MTRQDYEQRIRVKEELRDILDYVKNVRISPYSVQMRENTDQKTSEYGLFSCNVTHLYCSKDSKMFLMRASFFIINGSIRLNLEMGRQLSVKTQICDLEKFFSDVKFVEFY